MNELMYCIIHEAWVHPTMIDYVPGECVFTFSPPPELPEDWELDLIVPDADEMERINLNANELLMDLELV